MKRVVLSLALFASVVAVSAQPRAIGARLGYGVEFSYQHGLGNNMLQIDAGLPFLNSIQAAVVYDWIFPISSWKEAGSWNWYAGVGGGLGIYNMFNHKEAKSAFFIGIAGMIGIEYNFKFPLQLSLDYRPIIGPTFGDDVYLRGEALHTGAFGLGIRYKF
jgi:hypothetical protein